MKGRTILIVAIVTIAVFSVAGVALASPWKGMMGLRGLGGTGKLLQDPSKFTPPAQTLGLTDGQVAQIQAIQKAASDQMQPLQVQMLQKKAELRSIMWQKSPDQAALAAKLQEIEQLSQQMQTIATQEREQILAVLTPDQQAKFNQAPGLGLGGCGKGGRFGKDEGQNGTTDTTKKSTAPTSAKGSMMLKVKGL